MCSGGGGGGSNISGADAPIYNADGTRIDGQLGSAPMSLASSSVAKASSTSSASGAATNQPAPTPLPIPVPAPAPAPAPAPVPKLDPPAPPAPPPTPPSPAPLPPSADPGYLNAGAATASSKVATLLIPTSGSKKYRTAASVNTSVDPGVTNNGLVI